MKTITLFLLAIWCFSDTSGDDPKHWDYLMLSLRWPPTLCNFTGCTAVPQPVDFIIHGLWPTREPDIEPEHCDFAPPFNMDELKPLSEELMKYWPNLFPDATVHEFWHHEWHDHGRCAVEDKSIPTFVDYFRVTLEFRKKLDLLKRMQDSGIQPNNDTVLQLDDVAQQLKNLFNVNVQLYCLKHHHKDPRLFEVRFCFKPDLTLMDCLTHVSCYTPPSTLGMDTCAINPRDEINSLLGSKPHLGYSAQPCPKGPLVFPTL